MKFSHTRFYAVSDFTGYNSHVDLNMMQSKILQEFTENIAWISHDMFLRWYIRLELRLQLYLYDCLFCLRSLIVSHL